MNITEYEHTTNADGHLVVHDVPIFLECSRVMRNKKGELVNFKFDRDWIEKAASNVLQAHDEGYFPPLHIRHHELGKAAARAGMFRVTGTREIVFRGEVKLAIIAELTITDWKADDDVKSLRLPYRSVEIHSFNKPFIDSCALLDSEPPFLQLPVLRLKPSASETPQEAANVPIGTFSRGGFYEVADLGEPVVASRSQGEGCALLFRAEEHMEDTDTMAPEGEKAEVSDEFAAAIEAVKSGKLQVSEYVELVKAIQEMEASLNTDAEGEGEEDEESGDDAPAKAQTPGEPMKAKAEKDGVEPAKAGDENDTAIKMAKLQAEKDAADIELAQLREENAAKADVDAALERLGNRPLGEDPRATLLKFRTEHGRAAFAAYVETTFAAIPEREVPRPTPKQGDAGNLPPIAMKFQALGASAVELAAQKAREHATLRAAGMQSSLEDYVTLSLQDAGFALSN